MISIISSVKVWSVSVDLLARSCAYETYRQTDRPMDRQGDSYMPLKSTFAGGITKALTSESIKLHAFVYYHTVLILHPSGDSDQLVTHIHITPKSIHVALKTPYYKRHWLYFCFLPKFDKCGHKINTNKSYHIPHFCQTCPFI